MELGGLLEKLPNRQKPSVYTTETFQGRPPPSSLSPTEVSSGLDPGAWSSPPGCEGPSSPFREEEAEGQAVFPGVHGLWLHQEFNALCT